MNYNYNFALGSVLFIGLTATFYLRQRRMHDLQDHLYTVMLLGGLTAVFFDFAAAAVEPVAMSLPLWVLYAANALFILGEQVCLPAVFLYSVSASERFNRMNAVTFTIAFAPFAVVLAMLALSPFGTGGLFYFDALHIYRPGAAHWVMYAASALYLTASCIVLLCNYRVVDSSKRAFILLFVLLIVCAMVIQIYSTRLLLVTSAAALSLTAMYYLLRTPGEQVDPLTGAFSRSTLSALLRNLNEKKCSCTLVLYSVLNYDDIVRTHGPQLSDGFLAALSEKLRSSSPGCSVVYMNGDEFTVVVERVLDGDALHALWQNAPNSLAVEQGDIPVKLALAALSHQYDTPPEKTLTALDFLSRRIKAERQEGLFVEDSAFREKCSRLVRLESDIENILHEGAPVLLAKPVWYAESGPGGVPAMLDVSLGLRHGELGDVSADELLQAVTQSGRIRWYYERLTELTAERSRVTEPAVRFCLPLLSAGLIRDDMASALFDLVTDAGMEPKRIVLRLYERDLSEEMPAVYDNIRRLYAFGFGFRLDEFAEGYTDMSFLGSLPLGTVMIDGSLMRNTGDNARALSLLRCVIALLKETGKEVACAGVDSAADLTVARAVGADLLCGAYAPGDR